MTTSKPRSTLKRHAGDESELDRYRRLNRNRQAKLRAGRRAEAQAALEAEARAVAVDKLILSALFSRPTVDKPDAFERAFRVIVQQAGTDLKAAGFAPEIELRAAMKRHKKTRNAKRNDQPTPIDTPVTQTVHNIHRPERIADWTDHGDDPIAQDFDHITYEDPKTGEIRHISDRDGEDYNDDPDPEDVGVLDDDDDVPEEPV